MLYSFTATKWYRTVAVVEVGYTKTNNVKNYIRNYDEFRVDVLASGAEVLDNLNIEFNGIYVDDDVSLSKKRGGKEKSLLLGNGFYAIEIISTDTNKSIHKINEILKPIIIKNRNDLEYALKDKILALNTLDSDINRTKNILLSDAKYQLDTIKKEAPKIEAKIEEISNILSNQNKQVISSTYNTQVGSSDYGLSSLIQYKNNMIRDFVRISNEKLFNLEATLLEKNNQKLRLENDISFGYKDTSIKSIANLNVANNDKLVILILTLLGFFISVFSVLIWDVVKKRK